MSAEVVQAQLKTIDGDHWQIILVGRLSNTMIDIADPDPLHTLAGDTFDTLPVLDMMYMIVRDDADSRVARTASKPQHAFSRAPKTVDHLARHREAADLLKFGAVMGCVAVRALIIPATEQDEMPENMRSDLVDDPDQLKHGLYEMDLPRTAITAKATCARMQKEVEAQKIISSLETDYEAMADMADFISVADISLDEPRKQVVLMGVRSVFGTLVTAAEGN